MHTSLLHHQDTIVAPATAPGTAALAIVRLSGPDAIALCNRVFPAKDLQAQPSHTLHFGTIRDGDDIVDEVVVSLYKAPRSFTREDVVEISCHGSNYIVRRLVQLFIRQGARMAQPGEFTKRAFLNGQFDLAQAEAVGDLIAAESETAHRAALHQMRGGFSRELHELREKLVHFASMVELELDFGEEDVEFANRDDLRTLIRDLHRVIDGLIRSFDLGNVIKNGVPTVIVGKPNAGKSTLLNKLLNEEKAIVSDIPGTTRDFIEDELVVGGVTFRFIDTAGLRETQDTIEALGVQRTQEKMRQASLILYLFDATDTDPAEIPDVLATIRETGTPVVPIANKVDQLSAVQRSAFQSIADLLFLSAATGEGLEALQQRLLATVDLQEFRTGNTTVTNLRHYESLLKTREALDQVLASLDAGVTGDFLAMDIRQSLHHLGEITGEITTDDLLANIFSKFCIGK
ncbi:tRNA modification GTPase [Catalinimonas alkaloidigena]|uniref:tRNA modification GTPase MnmE n=1 Tax=Catalinimonas alkaloidigena TaxID=1075417 RepID=A0A1G9T317_9BACT|nr:tRNA uridine-5-carboxymethylaminomethyl(34) synthesis GTPase MnmE [Catalinimonas alkaloidigena]SDM42050.1 tRNA modification GTPase [Catalinimonas alkaloidigena]